MNQQKMLLNKFLQHKRQTGWIGNYESRVCLPRESMELEIKLDWIERSFAKQKTNFIKRNVIWGKVNIGWVVQTSIISKLSH